MIYMVYAHKGEIESFAGPLNSERSPFKPVRARGADAGKALAAALSGEKSGPPELILNVGFAGSLDPDLAPGQAVSVAQLKLETSAAWLDTLIAGAAVAPAPGLSWDFAKHRRVRCLTTREAVADPDIREALRNSTGAEIVDMEAAHLFAVAVSAGIPFAAVKVVSDHADGSARKDAVGQAVKWSNILGQAVLDREGAFWMSR